jgi:site-specific DNA recombinase
MKKVAIYVRVSTKEQAEEGYSIDEQLERLRKYCEARDWKIANEYVDAGFSGASLERPAMQRLIKDCNANKVDMVLVYKLDRLSRKQRDTLYLIEDIFNAQKIGFTSMQENIDTSTPYGLVIVGVLSAFSQLERSVITERMSMGREARAKEGLWHGGGHNPIGYDYTDGQLIINEYEAMQIRKIYDMFESGASISEIRNFMHARFTNNHGNWHSHSSVYSVLETPVIAGKIKFKDAYIEGQHEAIIPIERFERVQALMKARRKNLTSAQKNPFKRTSLLGGLIFCGNCGARYFTTVAKSGRTEETKKTIRYYTCYSRRKSNKAMIMDANCKNLSIREDAMNEIIIDEIMKLHLVPENVDRIVENKDTKKDRELIDSKIEELNNQTKKLVELYSLGSIPFDMISDKMNAINSEISALEEEKMGLEDAVVSPQEAKERLVDARRIFTEGTFEEQVALVRFLISQIILFDDRVEIYWNFE